MTADLGFYAYVAVVALVLVAPAAALHAVMQPARFENPGLRAYKAPAAVRTLYPQPGATLAEIPAEPPADAETEELWSASPTTAQSTAAADPGRAEGKHETPSFDQLKMSKHAAVRNREHRAKPMMSEARADAATGHMVFSFGTNRHRSVPNRT